MSLIVDFYINNKPNAHGDRLSDIWKYERDILESKHNYIQWLFPTRKRSLFNWKAPRLTQEDIDALVDNDLMIKNLKQSLNLMLNFYGFELKGNYIFKSKDFDTNSRIWLLPKNHNYRRISRILECLEIFELDTLKKELQNTLIEICNEYPDRIDEITKRIWQNI